MRIRYLLLVLLLLAPALGISKLRPGAATMAKMRVALIVGNSTYPGQSLANPHNDVELVAKAARNAGFGTVVTGLDLNAMELKHALLDFSKKAAGAEVALVYFAGDGLVAEDRHWLRGSHEVEPEARAKAAQSVEMAEVVGAVAGAHIRMVALDACFLAEDGMAQSALTPVAQRNDPTGNTLILYAATPGKDVLDSAGKGTSNSPFAISFAHALDGKIPVQLIGDLVRIDVFITTRKLSGTIEFPGMKEPQMPFIAENIEGVPMYLVAPLP